VVVEADGRWYVGPDNGLLSLVRARSPEARCWRIEWQPDHLSKTFHGRDLFAPVAAMLATDSLDDDMLAPKTGLDVEFSPDALPRVIYVDHFGNCWTGISGELLTPDDALEVGNQRIAYAKRFSAASKGQLFWYVNSSGLVEIAANRDHAARLAGLSVGSLVTVPQAGRQRH